MSYFLFVWGFLDNYTQKKLPPELKYFEHVGSYKSFFWYLVAVEHNEERPGRAYNEKCTRGSDFCWHIKKPTDHITALGKKEKFYAGLLRGKSHYKSLVVGFLFRQGKTNKLCNWVFNTPRNLGFPTLSV